MKSNCFLGAEDLPPTLPIFPLAGALLLPRGELPLNIFEPRYLVMVQAALGTPDRLIGMIQPREEGAQSLYSVGCAGRITHFTETEDARFLITLSGICRFHCAEELPQQGGYRRVRPDFSSFLNDLTTRPDMSLDRVRLMALLKSYFRVEGLSCDWDKMRDVDDDLLMTKLAMICPFGAPEKQALLEAEDVMRRSTLFLDILEMAVRQGQYGTCGKKDSPCH